MPTLMLTGANRGLGLELTRQFADLQWQVLACCRRPDVATELQQIAAQQPQVTLYPLDVTDVDAIQRLSAELADVSIDILLNNAAIFGPRGIEVGDVGAAEVAAWLDVFQTNSIAPWLVTQAFLPQVARSARKIVAIMSSRAGSLTENTSGGMPIYRSSKTAVNQVVVSLAHALRPQGITVTALHPGWVHTEMGGVEAPLSPQKSAKGLVKVLQGLTVAQSGGFYDYRGEEIDW